MRVFHRFTHTVSASIDSLLDQIENQEAVVTASIRDVEHGAGRVRVHRKRCERRIAELEQRISALSAESRIWKQRAQRLRDDRSKALECVRRHLAAEQAQSAHVRELDQQRGLLEKICADEHAIETKLSELRTRCAALSSREARSAAQAGAERAGDLDAVFDRWEARIEGAEAFVDRAPGPDAFARTLSLEEEQARTEAELERILAETEEPAS
jgi:phage shock protein A